MESMSAVPMNPAADAVASNVTTSTTENVRLAVGGVLTRAFCSLSLGQSILTCVIGLVTWGLAVAVYRLTLHPLAKYPGPFWRKISDWPLILSCYRGDRHIQELLDHDKYGPIVRYGPNSLSIATAEGLSTIHGSRANVRKGDWYKTLDISAGAPSVQMVLDKSEHVIRRRFISPAFSERAVKEAERLINESAVKLADQIHDGENRKEWSGEINFADWATFYSFDFISDLSFGMSFNMLEEKDTRYIPGVLKSASIFLYGLGYLPMIEWLHPLMGSSVQGLLGGSAADSLKYTALANQRLADRIAAEEGHRKNPDRDAVRKDVFHYLLNAETTTKASKENNNRTFTLEEMQADSALLIAAGSDGVGITVAAAMFYLLTNPETYTRLVSEIRSAFQSPSEIANPALNSLPYFHAVFEETLRLNPPKSSALPRTVLEGGLSLPSLGIHIPANTTVGVPPYALHHDEKYFPNPWKFSPERWLQSSSSPAAISLARSAFMPFLIGPMNCIGKSVAYVACKLALAHLLLRYDFELVRDENGQVLGSGRKEHAEKGRRREEEYQMEDFILGFRDGPCVRIKERDGFVGA